MIRQELEKQLTLPRSLLPIQVVSPSSLYLLRNERVKLPLVFNE